MEIKILKELQVINRIGPFINKGLSLERIEALEQAYNNGNPFPRGLRELLYLAGDDCNVLDYSTDTAEKLQQRARQKLTSYGMTTLTRPFYCIDTMGGYASAAFTFVYTDVPGEDPLLYSAYLDENRVQGFEGAFLSAYINVKLDNIKQGRNPF